jgi:hypothetical protein
MYNALKARFPSFQNEQDLRLAIESICAEFGKIARLNIISTTQGTRRQCVCFLRLDSEDAEQKLRQKYQTNAFASDLFFIVDVDENWSS